MINFTKSFFTKEPKSEISKDELSIGSSGSSYAEKVVQQDLLFSQMYQMYYANPWIRACVDRTVDRTADINPVVKPVSMEKNPDDNTKREIDRVAKLIAHPNSNGESFFSLRKKITRDTLIYDASCLEIARGKGVRDKENDSVELYAVAGDQIKLNVDEKGMYKDPAFIQVNEELKEVARWSAEEMLYFIANPVAGKVYGVSPLESLVQTVTAELYTAQHNLDFFYNNATPRFAVLIEGMGTGQGDAALTRFKTWWDTELKGQPHRPIMIGTEGGSIKLEKLGLTNDEMQFKEYSMFLLMKIMSVYRMQPIVLGIVDSALGKTNSVEQVRLFKQDAIKPQLTMFAHHFNLRVVFAALGLKSVYLDFDLDLADKGEQAVWHARYLNSGVVTINEIRVQGLGLNRVSWGDVPYLQNNVTPFGVEGSAVPPGPGDSLVEAPEDTANPAVLISKKVIKDRVESNEGLPVGWEGLDPSVRLDMVENIIKQRERYLSKVYILPKNITLDREEE